MRTFESLSKNKYRLIDGKILSVMLFLALSIFLVTATNAQTITELQSKIDQRNADIKALEKEIAEYQNQINDLADQANTLSATIKSLDLTQKKLQADIKITENKIEAKNYEIKELSYQIVGKEENIVEDRKIISGSLALLQQSSDKSLVEFILSKDSVSSAWSAVNELGSVQSHLVAKINDLRQIKAGLEVDKADTQKAKDELETLKSQLNDQRQVVLNTQSEKNDLLAKTKKSESAYKKLLADREALRNAYEKEVLQFESQLRLAVDATKLPRTGSGVLSWPLDKVYITQYFGNTPFATANAQVYGGKGHNGIDLRAPVGTPVKASMSGTVIGVGNTDVGNCLSYGKWVMIDHKNGLTSLYAHLSLQNVREGDVVSTGQLIGYSGNTGYSTGPHLHFGVYATEGIKIAKFENSINCRNVTLPLADFKAYLNPLSYL